MGAGTTSMAIISPHLLHYAPPVTSPRPNKRRRISPPLWRTSQTVLTLPELETLLISAGVSASTLRHIDIAHLTPSHLQIPKGLMPLEWVLQHLDAPPPDLDLPLLLHELLAPSSSSSSAPQRVPQLVTAAPQRVPLASLHLPIPIACPVWTFKVARGATPALTTAAILRLFPQQQQQQFLFRGTHLRARGFLAPVLPAAASAELGAGLYTTPQLEYAVHMAGVGPAPGVVYVFLCPDVEGLRVFEAAGREWAALVCREHRMKKKKVVGGVAVGKGLRRADVVVGGVSADCWEAREHGGVPVVDPGLVQCVWRSGEACRRLAEGVVAVVFLE